MKTNNIKTKNKTKRFTGDSAELDSCIRIVLGAEVALVGLEAWPHIDNPEVDHHTAAGHNPVGDHSRSCLEDQQGDIPGQGAH